MRHGFWSSVVLTGNNTLSIACRRPGLFWSGVTLTGNNTSSLMVCAGDATRASFSVCLPTLDVTVAMRGIKVGALGIILRAVLLHFCLAVRFGRVGLFCQLVCSRHELDF